jgi:hypothetical protein
MFQQRRVRQITGADLERRQTKFVQQIDSLFIKRRRKKNDAALMAVRL